ncbi:hypothetical protein [Streptomyces alfalfae]
MRDCDAPQAGGEIELPAGMSARRVMAGLAAADRCREAVDVVGLVEPLPRLLRRATAHAHVADSLEAWSMLADVYSTVYWLAARHRWMDLAELAVTRQRRAVVDHMTHRPLVDVLTGHLVPPHQHRVAGPSASGASGGAGTAWASSAADRPSGAAGRIVRTDLRIIPALGKVRM